MVYPFHKRISFNVTDPCQRMIKKTTHNNRLVPRPLLIILSTDLPMYSPANKQPHLVHVKHHKCHCLSRAKSDCPLRISSPHPAHPTDRQSYIGLISKQWHKWALNSRWQIMGSEKQTEKFQGCSKLCSDGLYIMTYPTT